MSDEHQALQPHPSFQLMVKAETPIQLLSAFIMPQVEGMPHMPSELRDALSQSVENPSQGALLACAEYFIDDDPPELLADLSLEAHQFRIVMRLNSAVYQLLAQNFRLFNQEIEKTFEIVDYSLSALPLRSVFLCIVQIVDLGWPLVWYRLRHYDLDTPLDAMLAFRVLFMRDSTKDPHLYALLDLFFRTFALFSPFHIAGMMEEESYDGPNVLRTKTFLERAARGAKRIDETFNRWSFERVIREFADDVGVPLDP